jgi:hypothetical protein
MRHCLLVALLVAAASSPLAAQTESNRYLPINSWTTPYVEHLIRAGVLRGLDPLTRPLKRADVARAVAAVDTTDLPASLKGNLRLLAQELEERPDTVRWTLEAQVAAQGASDPSRWTVRPERENSGLFWQGGLTGSLEFPHVALVTSPYFDTRLRRDTQFVGKKDRFIAGDNAEAYVTASWKYADLFFGIEPRNWGPPEVEGLILSTSPYPYDHMFIRLGPRRFRIEMIATRLDNLPMWDSGGLANRFLSVHRLVVMPSDRFAFALSEAALYAAQGPPYRDFEPWFLNPVNLWDLFSVNYQGSNNELWALSASYQTGGSLRLAGQLYADDIQLDRKTPHDKKPEELGYTLSVTGGALRGSASWSALYTRVDALDYRTAANEEQYSLRGVGLARDHSDYDQWTLRATWAPVARALIGPEITYLRQGQGDFRLRYPPDSAFSDTLILHTGVVERTLRVAAQGSWSPTPGLDFSFDVGRHFVWNANHVRGARGDRWVWRVRAEIRRRITGAIR